VAVADGQVGMAGSRTSRSRRRWSRSSSRPCASSAASTTSCGRGRPLAGRLSRWGHPGLRGGGCPVADAVRRRITHPRDPEPGRSAARAPGRARGMGGPPGEGILPTAAVDCPADRSSSRRRSRRTAAASSIPLGRLGRRHVWSVDLTAKNPKPVQLTTAANQYVNPAVSPDGRSIALIQGSGAANRGRPRKRAVPRGRGAPDCRRRSSSRDAHENRGSGRRMPAVAWHADGTGCWSRRAGTGRRCSRP